MLRDQFPKFKLNIEFWSTGLLITFMESPVIVRKMRDFGFIKAMGTSLDKFGIPPWVRLFVFLHYDFNLL